MKDIVFICLRLLSFQVTDTFFQNRIKSRNRLLRACLVVLENALCENAL